MTNSHHAELERMHMKSKVLLNKSEKKKRIEIAALKLFSCHDVNKISIDQIVQEAGVAKGTFYLHFHDKVQLINHLIVKESSSIINEALQEAKRQNIDDKIDELIFLIDHVIAYFRMHPEVINIIQKNLSWNLVGGKLREGENYEVAAHMNSYCDFLETIGYTRREAYQLLFMILELVSTLCYTSIILHQPDDIEQLKPMLFTTIRKMIERS